MEPDLARQAGGANLPQPVPFVVPTTLPPPPPPMELEWPPADVDDPPLPGRFPLH
jgi:hypothetical protein